MSCKFSSNSHLPVPETHEVEDLVDFAKFAGFEEMVRTYNLPRSENSWRAQYTTENSVKLVKLIILSLSEGFRFLQYKTNYLR